MRYKIFMFNNVDLFSKPMVKFKRAVSDLPFPEADHPITKSSQKSSSHLMSQSQRFQYLWNQINYLVTINKLWELWTHMSNKKRSLKKKRTAKFPKDEFAAFFIIWLYFFVFFTIEKKRGRKESFYTIVSFVHNICYKVLHRWDDCWRRVENFTRRTSKSLRTRLSNHQTKSKKKE